MVYMKKIITLFIPAAACLYACATDTSTVWTLQSEDFTVDTLYHATVGPGTTETELRLTSKSVTNKIHNVFYTVTDLNNEYVEMRVAKGGNHMRKLETVPDIAARMNRQNELYFAGVNADFFNMSYPFNICGSCIADGYLTNRASNGGWYHLSFDDKNVPTFSHTVNIANSGFMTFPGNTRYEFYLNQYRDEDQLIVYTPQWEFLNPYTGTTSPVGRTGQNQWGCEVKVRPVGENIMFGNKLQLEVISEPVTEGNLEIPADGYVVSGHGKAKTLVQALKKGDILVTDINITVDGRAMPVKHLVGGFPQILTDSRVEPTSNGIDHLKNPEPRTAVGYNSDKLKLYMLVVDGRNAGGSSGVTQRVLADIMKNVGCTDAMNFDGGGSSTMYIDGLGIKNVPSSSSLDSRPEGQPRTVVNALFAVAVAPEDYDVASIEIRDKHVALSEGESYTPVVYSYNRYGVMISTDFDECTFRIPSQVAKVEGSSIVAVTGSACTAMLEAEYNGASYSVPVDFNGGGDMIAGVGDIVVGDESAAPTEYFTPDGQRIPSPSPHGVTIVRRGTKVTKLIVR